jgi:type 2A phosphatase activator TIP41
MKIFFKMSKSQSIQFNNQWTISSTHGPILASEGAKRLDYEQKLGTHHLPEMIFDQTQLTLVHRESQLSLSFCAFDALKQIDLHQKPEDIPKVAMSDVWSKSRAPNQPLDYVKPYDWTFTTRYQGNRMRSTPSPLQQRLC